MYSNNKHSSYYGDEIVHTFPEYPFDYQYLINRLKSYRNPRNKIGLMIKKGQIIRIKKGIYIPTRKGKIMKDVFKKIFSDLQQSWRIDCEPLKAVKYMSHLKVAAI